jgi:hypothetical protein
MKPGSGWSRTLTRREARATDPAVADATMPAGPPEIQQATLYNVRNFFGWVTGAEDVATALREAVTLYA